MVFLTSWAENSFSERPLHKNSTLLLTAGGDEEGSVTARKFFSVDLRNWTLTNLHFTALPLLYWMQTQQQKCKKPTKASNCVQILEQTLQPLSQHSSPVSQKGKFNQVSNWQRTQDVQLSHGKMSAVLHIDCDLQAKLLLSGSQEYTRKSKQTRHWQAVYSGFFLFFFCFFLFYVFEFHKRFLHRHLYIFIPSENRGHVLWLFIPFWYVLNITRETCAKRNPRA